MIRRTLERFGLESKDIDAIMANFGSIEDIINSNPSHISSITSLDEERARELQEFLKKQKNGNVGKDFLKRWGKVSSEEDLKSAYEEYTRLSKLYPKSPVVWEIRGEILEKMGRFEEARKSYQTAYRLYIQKGETPPKDLKEKVEKRQVTIPNKAGLSNGFGNINGFKNGIINGTGIVNGTSGGWHGPRSSGTWKVPVAILLVFLIIAAPLVGFIFFEKHYVYAVDGNFSEWKQGVPYYGLKEGKKDVNINYAKFHSVNNGIYFYVNLAGKDDFKSPHGIYIFFDTDNSTKTGYLVEGIGADYMVEIYGWNNTLKGKILYKFNSTDQNNYGGFEHLQSIPAVLENNQIEGFAPINTKHFRAIVISYNYANQQDIAPCPNYGENSLIVEEYAEQKVIPVNDLSDILQLRFTGPKFTLHSISFKIYGTANVSALGNFTLELGGKILSTNYSIQGEHLNFTGINAEIPRNSTINVLLTANPKNTKKTVMLAIENIYVNVSYFIENVIIGADYIGTIPSTPSIDGSFLDWKNVKTDSPNDVVSPANKSAEDPNIDILRYSAQEGNSTPLLVYLQVQGKMLGGTDVPVVRAPLPPKQNNSVIINETNVPHKKIYGMDTIDIFINSDDNKSTGFSPVNYSLGADYLVQIYGRDGVAYNASLYRYVNGNWSFVRNVKYALGYHSIELNTFMNVKKGDVLIVTFNWKDYMDVSDEMIKIKTPKYAPNAINISLENLQKDTTNYLDANSNVVKKLKLALTQNFGTNVPVTTSKFNETKPSIVRTSDGTLWVVYNNESDYLSLAISNNNGSSWSVYHPFNLQATNPIIITDSYNDVYIFYENHSSISNFSYIKINSTGVASLYIYSSTNWWSNVYDLSAANYENYIYLSFDYYLNSYYYVGILYSSDLGASWNGYLIYNVSSYPGVPQIAITSGTQPKVFVAFEYYYSYEYSFITLIYNNSKLGNNTWTLSHTIYEYTSSGYGYRGARIPTIATYGDNIYVAFNTQYGDMISFLGIHYWIPIQWDIFLAYSTDNGETWSTLQVTSSSDDEVYPWIISYGLNIYILYLNATSGYICVAESTDGGNSWVTGIKVSDEGSGVAIYHTVSATYSNGNLYVVWTDNRNGQDDIYFDYTVPEFNNAIIPMITIIGLGIILRRRRNKNQ